jgi:pimeloyl-ACP methyl ester carboxylesterase
LLGGLALGAAAAAGWAAQHRAVARRQPSDEEVAAEELALPEHLHHSIEVDDGGRIHAIERGHGPPLVLLHGFMLDASAWVHQLHDLSERHRVIAVDMRGHGQSTLGAAGFNAAPGADAALADLSAPGVRRMAADVETVLGALDVERCTLVGHSMGGMVALQLANGGSTDDFRRRVSGMALVSTTAGPFTHLPGMGGMSRVAGPVSARAVHIADRWGVRTVASDDVRWWLTRLAFGADASAAQVRFVERLHMATPARTLGELLPSIAVFDLSRFLSTIDLPVLVVVGSHDRLTPPRHALRTADALPRAQLVELPRCGHMPMLERRFEFARLLEEFAAKIA